MSRDRRDSGQELEGDLPVRTDKVKEYCPDVITFGVTGFQCGGGHEQSSDAIHVHRGTDDNGVRVAMTWQRKHGQLIGVDVETFTETPSGQAVSPR
jgi:hypothetical protein